MFTRFCSVLVICGALGMSLPALGADAPPSENLDKLIAGALSANPDLRSVAAHWETMKTKVAQAGALDDPMLMLKLQNGVVTDPFSFSRDSMTQKVIGISQQLPFYGKRALRAEVAAREADEVHFTHLEKALELTRSVKETYYRLFFTDRALALIDRNIAIMDSFVTLAQTKYSVGQGVQQDIFKAQLERSKMLDMRISLEQERKSLSIALNALLSRPADTPVGAIPDFELGPEPPSAKRLMAVAEDTRPGLTGLKAQVKKWQVAHALAKKEYYPDFNVAFEYMQRDPAMGSDGADMYSLGVTFNLPVNRARRAAVAAEASSEITMSSEDLRAMRNQTEAGIADLLAQMERRRRLAQLYKEGIVPQAEQSLESATIGYRVNKVDFLTLLDSRVTLFNYQRDYFDSLADYQVKKAQLEALVGMDLADVAQLSLEK